MDDIEKQTKSYRRQRRREKNRMPVHGGSLRTIQTILQKKGAVRDDAHRSRTPSKD